MKRRILTALFSVVAVSLFLAGMHESASAQRPNKRARNLAVEGDKLYNARKYEEALQKYSEAISISPRFPRARFYKGSAHFKIGQFADAVNELDVALSQGYRPLEVLTVRMEARFGNDDYDGALEDVNKVIARSPSTSYYHVFLGRVKIIKGDFAGAVDSLKKSIDLGERGSDVHYYLAVAYGGSGNLAGQGASAAEAVRLGTANAGEAWFLVGDSQHRRKMFQESVQSFRNAINAFKNDIDTGRTTENTRNGLYQAYLDLADVYRNLNRFNDAIEIAQEALSLRPDDGTIHTSLAWYYILSGQTANAIVAGQRAVQLSAGDYLAYTNLCRAYIDEGEFFYKSDELIKSKNSFNKALANCMEALKIEPEDGETNYYLGRTYFYLDDVAKSDSYYRKSVPLLEGFTKENPNYSDAYYLLGNAYFATKQNSNAIATYRDCLRISPRFARVRYNLGFVLVQEKKWAEARAEQAVLTEIDKELASKLLEVINEKAPKN